MTNPVQWTKLKNNMADYSVSKFYEVDTNDTKRMTTFLFFYCLFLYFCHVKISLWNANAFTSA